MGLGHNSGNSNGTLIILKPTTKSADGKDAEKPFFAVSRKQEDGKFKQDEDESISSVSGNLTNLKVVRGDYDGNPTHTVKLILSDPAESESYLVDLRMSVLGRDILNKVLTLESTENVSISIYKNKKGYAASAVRQNDNMIKWKFERDELPAPIEIKHPVNHKVLSRDYTELNEFFAKAAEEFAENLKIQGRKNAPQPETSEPVNEDTKYSAVPSRAVENSEEDDDNDIPF